MAQISKPAIPLKMYRNFAVATIVLTICIALIADDGPPQSANSDAQAAATQHQQVRQEAEEDQDTQEEAAPQYGQARLERRSGNSPDNGIAGDGGFGSEVDGSYGAPMDAGASAAAGSSIAYGSRPAVSGYSQAYLNSLTEEQYEQLVTSMRDSGMLDQSQRRRNMAALEADSRRRSGSDTGNE